MSSKCMRLPKTAIRETYSDLHRSKESAHRLIRFCTTFLTAGAMGYMSYIDMNGDPQGNFTLLARRPKGPGHMDYGMYPVGSFLLNQNDTKLPVSIVVLFSL
jgi:hypothetical protein